MAHILLVDDDNAVREATTTLLRTCGYAVTALANGLKIEAAIAAHRPDLVVMDILMPDRDGIEIIIALRHNFPDLPVLVVSGSGENGGLSFLTMARSLGAAEALAKPFDGEKLLEMIETLLAGRTKTVAARQAGGAT